MGAAVLPFLPRRASSRWQMNEIAECYRVIDILGGVGMAVTLEADVSDEGEPWLIFVREDSQDVIIHIARINGQVVAASTASDTLFRGRSMRDVLQRILQAQPFILPASRPLGSDDRLLMHPATMLVAVVATAFLASQQSPALAGDGEVAFTDGDGGSLAEAAAPGRKQALSLDSNPITRTSPPSDAHHSMYAAAVAAAVLATVAILEGLQLPRIDSFLEKVRFTAASILVAEKSTQSSAYLPEVGDGAAGLDQDLLLRLTGVALRGLEDTRAAAAEAAAPPPSSLAVSSTTRAAEVAAQTISLQAGLNTPEADKNPLGLTLSTATDARFLPASGQAGLVADGGTTGERSAVFEGVSLNAQSGAWRSAGSSAQALASAAKTPAPLEGTSQAHHLSAALTIGDIGIGLAASRAAAVQSTSAPGSVASSAPSPAQVAGELPQATSNVTSAVASTLVEFSLGMADSKGASGKVSLSLVDVFWHSAAFMRSAGLDLYGTSHDRGGIADARSVKVFVDPPTVVAAPLDVGTSANKAARDAVTTPTKLIEAEALPLASAISATPVITSKSPVEASAPISKATLEVVPAGPVVPTPSPDAKLIETPTTALNPAVQAPVMVLTAADIVQTMKSLVSFAYDPRHEIVLKGQDLDILQILVKANPLIAGADRVLLSHGKILAGDGVMLMPGVALLPAEVFAPKLVASLPSTKEGALEVAFRDDLTVTLAGVIDI